MKSTKSKSILLCAIFVLNVAIVAPIYAKAIEANQNEMMAQTIEEAGTKIELLKSKYLEKGEVKPDGSPFTGVGIDDDGPASQYDYENDEQYLAENIIGMTALLKEFQATGVAKSSQEAVNVVFNKMMELCPSTTQEYGVWRSTYHKDSDMLTDRKYSIDQFMFLEFVSESYTLSGGDASMKDKIGRIYQDSSIFKANFTINGKVYPGGYYTTLEDNKQFTDTADNLGEPFPQDILIPLTNSSLWAAAGIAHFVTTQMGTTIDTLNKYSENGTLMAEEAFTFAEVTAWNPILGLYYEGPTSSFKGNASISVSTQIAALLACARLYQLTGKSMYLEKADLIISNIYQYFGEVGRGGIYTAINSTGHVVKMKTAYDNALFAYALVQLGIATGAEDVEIKGFIIGRPENKYMKLAFSVINFMNNYMWKLSTGGVFEGYVEFVDDMGNEIDNTPYSNSTRFTKSNMLAMYVLANIVYQSRTWVEWYETYAIITAVVLGVIVFAAVIMKIRSSEGSRVSRVVKGLMEEEE